MGYDGEQMVTLEQAADPGSTLEMQSWIGEFGSNTCIRIAGPPEPWAYHHLRKDGRLSDDASEGVDVLVTADLKGGGIHGVSNMLRMDVYL